MLREHWDNFCDVWIPPLLVGHKDYKDLHGAGCVKMENLHERSVNVDLYNSPNKITEELSNTHYRKLLGVA